MTDKGLSSPQPAQSAEDRILRRIPRSLLFAAGICSIPAALLFDLEAAGLLLLGGLFSAVNFRWLSRDVSGILAAPEGKNFWSLLRVSILRLILIIGVFFVIILFFSRKSIAFAAGFSLIIPVFLVEAAIGFSKLKQWKN